MKNNKYTKSRLAERLPRICMVAMALGIFITFNVVNSKALSNNDDMPLVVVAEPIDETDVVPSTSGVRMSELANTSGVASLMDSTLTEDDIAFMNEIETAIESEKAEELPEVDYVDGFEEPTYIRCTGYCDYGYTKSGEYVRHGIVAGKKEWLGYTCLIYEVADDGSCGDIIGEYEFLDTGYGINGSLVNGTSIDVWHPSEDAVWDWMGTYGDYVYIQIIKG